MGSTFSSSPGTKTSGVQAAFFFLEGVRFGLGVGFSLAFEPGLGLKVLEGGLRSMDR